MKPKKKTNNPLKNLGIRSKPAFDALYKSGAGIHADQVTKYTKRKRHGKHKKEEENDD
jgi:hypothetical protein